MVYVLRFHILCSAIRCIPAHRKTGTAPEGSPFRLRFAEAVRGRPQAGNGGRSSPAHGSTYRPLRYKSCKYSYFSPGGERFSENFAIFAEINERPRPLKTLPGGEGEAGCVSPTDMSHRILLVDDEVDILEFVKYNLVKEGYEVYTAQNGADGLREAVSRKPHLILLDMMMPVMDGVQTCRAIREHPGLKDTMVVFLSALGDEEQQLTAYGAGADDYIAKPIKMKLLVSRVQAILKRIDGRDGLSIDTERYTVTLNGECIPLPRKEFALLTLLCSEPGRLFSREEIYQQVWGSEVVVGDRTIDVHIRKLRQKIGTGHIVTVKGVGYKYEA